MYWVKNILSMHGIFFGVRETIAVSQSVGFHPLGNLFLNLLNTHEKNLARHAQAFEKLLFSSEKQPGLKFSFTIPENVQ